jgi:hypothetical protein
LGCRIHGRLDTMSGHRRFSELTAKLQARKERIAARE